MKRLVFLVTLFPALALASCSRTDAPALPEPSTAKQIEELSRKVDELKALLAEMRQGNSGADQRCRDWLDAQLIPGKTTLSDVQQLFGNNHFNLDRPDRDDVLTIQYSLNDITGKKIVLDFTKLASARSSIFDVSLTPLDSKSLLDTWTLEKTSEFSFHYCGFCPHVLVDADGWQLDGKMLAGAVGKHRERSDTLVLPRARVRNGKVNIKLANWAPEVEHLDKVELGFVAAHEGEQLDFDAAGAAYLWRELQGFHCAAPRAVSGRDHWHLKLDPSPGPAVLVLELRNTEKFQDLAKECYLHDQEPEADLVVAGGSEVNIPPCGTKFFRRVVIPLSDVASEIRLSCPAGMWWVRRAWLGSGQPVSMQWVSPQQSSDAAAALQARDGQRLRLGPDEDVEMAFQIPDTPNLRMALRLFGYYEFLGQ